MLRGNVSLLNDKTLFMSWQRSAIKKYIVNNWSLNFFFIFCLLSFSSLPLNFYWSHLLTFGNYFKCFWIYFTLDFDECWLLFCKFRHFHIKIGLSNLSHWCFESDCYYMLSYFNGLFHYISLQLLSFVKTSENIGSKYFRFAISRI